MIEANTQSPIFYIEVVSASSNYPELMPLTHEQVIELVKGYNHRVMMPKSNKGSDITFHEVGRIVSEFISTLPLEEATSPPPLEKPTEAPIPSLPEPQVSDKQVIFEPVARPTAPQIVKSEWVTDTPPRKETGKGWWKR